VKQDPDVLRFMETQYPPGWAYQAFAPLFTARFFDPAAWVELFKAAGARYIVTIAGYPLNAQQLGVSMALRGLKKERRQN